jgi:hypothetical protein
MCSEVEKIENRFKDASELEDTDKEGHGDCFFAGSTRESFGDCKEFLILTRSNGTEGICYV